MWQVGHLHRVPSGAQLCQPGQPVWGALPARRVRHGGDGVGRAGANGAERCLEVMIFPRAVQGSMGGILVMKWIISVFFDAVSVRWTLSPQHEAAGSVQGHLVGSLPCALLEGTLVRQ